MDLFGFTLCIVYTNETLFSWFEQKKKFFALCFSALVLYYHSLLHVYFLIACLFTIEFCIKKIMQFTSAYYFLDIFICYRSVAIRL